MEMHQVRYFLAVARTRNFTRAADECHVAQPSLTRAIKQLEGELGGDLFRRERPRAQLTELGVRMLPLLQQCYDSAVSAKSLASSVRAGEVGSLRLALSRTIDNSNVRIAGGRLQAQPDRLKPDPHPETARRIGNGPARRPRRPRPPAGHKSSAAHRA
jgi:DNA-binding transcriptional LysR family regulator